MTVTMSGATHQQNITEGIWKISRNLKLFKKIVLDISRKLTHQQIKILAPPDLEMVLKEEENCCRFEDQGRKGNRMHRFEDQGRKGNWMHRFKDQERKGNWMHRFEDQGRKGNWMHTQPTSLLAVRERLLESKLLNSLAWTGKGGDTSYLS